MPRVIKTAEQAAKVHAGETEVPIADSTIALGAAKVVPEIIDEVDDSAELIVTYGSLRIENGMTISPDRLQDEPLVTMTPKGETYTLMVVDPDAPTPGHPKYRSWLHWLVVNIPGNDPHRGEEVEAYMPPEPGKEKHRYVWLLFKQKGRVQARRPAKRQGFQVREWAAQHGLDTHPATGLWFWSAADEL